uniref:Epididymal-specific lipocalin-8-like n=1 Tax=Ailuropoda melanoleuca TaxID=9646 RepID=A0A7N5P5F1_AILME
MEVLGSGWISEGRSPPAPRVVVKLCPPVGDRCCWLLAPLSRAATTAAPRVLIAGFWREVGVASSQNLALKTPKRLEALFLTLGSLGAPGSLPSQAAPVGHHAISPLPLLLGHREIHVIDTDYEQYAILRLSLLWQGKDFHVLKYFTRSLEDEYGPGFWRFRELMADIGLYLVARHGRCAKLLKEVSF